MSRIKLDLKNNSAKNIIVKDKEYMIPKLTLYHRKLFGVEEINNDKLYEIVVPLLNKLFRVDDIVTNDVFEFLIVHLLFHNKMLFKTITIEEEVFNIDNMIIMSENEFLYEDNNYTFDLPVAGVIFNDTLEGMNKLQNGTEFDFNSFPPIFYRFSHKLFSTVGIIGSNGNILEGMNNIIDTFINQEEFEKLRR